MSKISQVGRFTYGHKNISVATWGEKTYLHIGSFCSIASGVSVFLGGNHRTDWITTYPFGHIFQSELIQEKVEGHPATKGDVYIGDDVWIGAHVTIMSGVTIGSGAVIGANSTVAKDVKPYEIVAGNPAKHIRFRFKKEIIDLLMELKWWELPVESIKEISKDLTSPPTVESVKELIKKFRQY